MQFQIELESIENGVHTELRFADNLAMAKQFNKSRYAWWVNGLKFGI